MPPKVVKTSRKVKNHMIGIDISVPSHEPATTPKLVKNYHVVVISSLPHFKDAIHDKDETVQFMVLRDYEAFENLQRDMLECFPNLKLPNLPRKYHLFVNQAHIEERQIAFDCLLKVLCKDKVMCTSTVFLKFLGFSHDADVTYFKRRAHYLRIDCSGHAEGYKAPETQLFSSDQVEDDHIESLPGDEAKSGDVADFSSAAGRMFVVDDIFAPEECTEVAKVDEHSELLDSVNEMEEFQRDTCTTPSTSAPYPADIANTETVQNSESRQMQTSDIVAYIQSNATYSDDLDIF